MRARAILCGVWLLQITGAACAGGGAEESVIKITASVRFPNPVQPWAKPRAAQQIGSGAIIQGKRILTNAHVVMYADEVHVQARADDDKVEARVVAIAPDIDLAVLSVTDDKFLSKKPALVRSTKLPNVQDNVAVYGFPIGGRDLSVTKGTISRLDVGHYGNRGPGVIIQVSAPINPGNSGGPAVVDGKMIGIVVSRVVNAQNIGSLIPNEEIDFFLEDIKDGRYDGKPVENTRVMYQSLVNPALRGMLGVGAEVKGMLVRIPEPPDAVYPLQQSDIVTRIGKHPIDNMGLVQLDNGLRVPFLYMVPRVARGGTVPFTLWRGGKTLQVDMPVSTRDNRLVPPYNGEPLSYFIHGPLVFAPAKSDDISLYAQMNPMLYGDSGPLVTRRFDTVRFPGEELVVVSAPMFTHKITRGYSNPVGRVVQDVNGTRIKNLRHLVETLRASKDKYLRFRFASDWAELLVFDRLDMERATAEIMEDQGITPARRGSPDLLKIWRAQ